MPTRYSRTGRLAGVVGTPGDGRRGGTDRLGAVPGANAGCDGHDVEATRRYSPSWADCSLPPAIPLRGAGRARPWSAGTIVDGRYRLHHRIGSGGTATVYCAEDLRLGRKVALKVLHRSLADAGESVERFRREAWCAAGLRHRHIVSVYACGEWDGTHYIAMEYVAGRSLKSIIHEQAPLEQERAIDLAAQILHAARFIHGRDIIHRDLKPDNVIVDDTGRLKVTDFGIARAGKSDITRTDSILGTVKYLSPEQARGLALTGASDLYSIGIILYELLAGRVPFEGESAVAVALKHVNERPIRLRAFNPAVTPELESTVMRALEKDPKRRFPDADAFIGALEQARVSRRGIDRARAFGGPDIATSREAA
jgi:eukaryotic-like serine/threonine-protein kinase